MIRFRMSRVFFVVLLLNLGLTLMTGCGTTPPPAQAPSVSSFDLAQAFEVDEAAAITKYKDKPVRITHLLAWYHQEEEKLFDVTPFDPVKKEGSVTSSSYLNGEQIKQIPCGYHFSVRLDDPKQLEGIQLQTGATVDGAARSEFHDLVEVEGTFDSLVDGVLIFKSAKIIKK